VFKYFLYFVFCSICLSLFSQTQVFKEKNKWGIKEKDQIIIKPVYDTIFNFDSTGKVCLTCAKVKGAHPNKFIKTPSVTYYCNYLNKKGQRLIIKQTGADTTSVFSLHKSTLLQYQRNSNIMTVSVKSLKHLVDKDFNQITSKGYDEINLSGEPQFLIAEKKSEGSVLLSGLINLKEEEVIPIVFSHIKVNSRDSLIIACTTGQGSNSEDDIFNYKGEKIAAYRKHVDLATKEFVVHKIFSPKEYYIVLNLKTKEEKIERAEEAMLYKDETLLMMNDGHWFTYDMNTHKKAPFDNKQRKK
jgi:hypothetical protein